MSNRPAGLKNRIFAAIIDFIAIISLTSIVMAIFNLTPIVNIYEDAANQANDIYNSIATSFNIGELVDVSGVLNLSVHSNVTSEDINHFNSLLTANNEFMSLYNKAINYRLLVNILVVGIVEAIYLLIIPVLNSKGQTLGKMLFSLGVIDIRTDMFLDKKNKVIRFLVGFGIETYLLLVFFKESSSFMVAIFSPLLVLTTIMFSQNKQALHDILSHAKVVDLKTATIFNSVEEKEAYDLELMNNKKQEKTNNKDIIETEVEEVEEEFIEEQVEEIVEQEKKLDNNDNKKSE